LKSKLSLLITLPLLVFGLIAHASEEKLSVVKSEALHNSEARRLIEAMPPVSNIIIGGGMVNCSSMSGANETMTNKKCAEPWPTILQQDPAFANVKMNDISFDPAITHPTFTYSITDERIAVFDALPSSLVSNESKKSLLAKLRRQLEDQTELKTAITFPEFDALLSNVSGILSTTEQAALRHSFVDEPSLTRSKRLVQARSVAFLSDTASLEIYREFIRAATVIADGKKPTIGVVTASAENPFNDHDIYYFALKSSGANVVWLPADGGLRKALDKNDCEHIAIDYAAYASKGSERQYFHMDKIFPDLAEQQKKFCLENGRYFNQTLSKLDGIFFAGGNQARHLDSFISRDEMGHTQKSARNLNYYASALLPESWS